MTLIKEVDLAATAVLANSQPIIINLLSGDTVDVKQLAKAIKPKWEFRLNAEDLRKRLLAKNKEMDGLRDQIKKQELQLEPFKKRIIELEAQNAELIRREAQKKAAWVREQGKEEIEARIEKNLPSLEEIDDAVRLIQAISSAFSEGRVKKLQKAMNKLCKLKGWFPKDNDHWSYWD